MQHRRRLNRDLTSGGGVNRTSAVMHARRHATLTAAICNIREWLGAGGCLSVGLAADLVAAAAAVVLLLSGYKRVGAGWTVMAVATLYRVAALWLPLLNLAAALTDHDRLHAVSPKIPRPFLAPLSWLFAVSCAAVSRAQSAPSVFMQDAASAIDPGVPAAPPPTQPCLLVHAAQPAAAC